MEMTFDQLHPEFAGTGIRRFQREEFVDGKNTLVEAWERNMKTGKMVDVLDREMKKYQSEKEKQFQEKHNRDFCL